MEIIDAVFPQPLEVFVRTQFAPTFFCTRGALLTWEALVGIGESVGVRMRKGMMRRMRPQLLI